MGKLIILLVFHHPYEEPKTPDLTLDTIKESINERTKLENFIIKEFGILKNS